MPELPVLNAREALNALRRAGFVVRKTTGGHLLLRHPDHGRIVSVPSHPGDLRRGTPAAIVQQSGLTVGEFVALQR